MWPFNKRKKLKSTKVKASRYSRSGNLDKNGWPLNVNTTFDDNTSPEQKCRFDLMCEAQSVRYNPYVEKYISASESIILGSEGFILDMNVLNSNGTPDSAANKFIEDSILEWKRKVSSCGRFSLRELIALLIREQRIDGEVFLRKQIIDGELKYLVIKSREIDTDYTVEAMNIYCGIQYDEYNRPVTYFQTTLEGRVSIPANEMKHIYKSKTADEYRGVTSLAPVLLHLSKLNKFNNASLDQHIISASHTIVFEQNALDSDAYDNFDTDEEGNPVSVDNDPTNYVKTLNSKEIGFVPTGYQAKSLDFGSSTVDTEAFNKVVLKTIASGLLIPHHVLSSDLKESSFSSLKFNSIFEAAHWSSIQMMFVEVYRSIVVDAISHHILNKDIPLPSSKLTKYTSAINVLGYKIPDLEPNKMAMTNKTNLELGLSTHTEILARTNRTVVDVLEEKKKEKQLEEEYGISLREVVESKPEEESD